MSKILEQDSGSSLDITSSASVGSVTPDRDLALAARLKLTSLNGAAATFTLRLVDSGNYVLASLAVPKDTAADTTAYLYIDVPLVKSSEAVTLKVESTNSSDTSATWETEWIDADWVNAGLIEGADATDQINAACDAAIADAALAEAADLAVVDGLVDAVKAKTDLLPASPAATGDIPTTSQIDAALSASHGSGAWTDTWAGDGDIAVDHDTGGTDALRYVASGSGVDGGIIRAYLTSEYEAGTYTVRGTAYTGSDGRWAAPMYLDAGEYTLTFSKPGVYATTTTEVSVS